MSRDLPTDLEDAIDEPVVRPFMALRIELPDPVYVWTGRGTLTFDDSDGTPQEWIGAGGVGAIDALEEASDGSATGVRASLFNIPSEFREDIAEQAAGGELFEVYIGALNETYQQVESVQLILKNRLDDYKITDAGTSITVEVTGESRSIDQRRPAIKRLTNEYQQRMHAGDKFLEYVDQMAEVSILWAQAEPKAMGSAFAGVSGIGGLLGVMVRTVRS